MLANCCYHNFPSLFSNNYYIEMVVLLIVYCRLICNCIKVHSWCYFSWLLFLPLKDKVLYITMHQLNAPLKQLIFNDHAHFYSSCWLRSYYLALPDPVLCLWEDYLNNLLVSLLCRFSLVFSSLYKLSILATSIQGDPNIIIQNQ